MLRSTITPPVGSHHRGGGGALAGLISRTSNLVKAWISRLLDQAEDPSVTLDYSYERQREMLQRVKKGVADVVTSKKRLELQTRKLEDEVVKLEGQARQALGAGPEDPARAALERKELAQIGASSQIDADLARLRGELEPARERPQIEEGEKR